MLRTGRDLYFIDIDGVLADISHRIHYAKNKEYDWFYSASELRKDAPIYEFNFLYKTINTELMDNQASVFFITGRPERTRLATMEWLQEHYYRFYTECLKDGVLKMRADGEYRKSPNVKFDLVAEVLDKYYGENGYANLDTAVIIDDDPLNVLAMKKAMKNHSSDINLATCLTFGTERISDSLKCI